MADAEHTPPAREAIVKQRLMQQAKAARSAIVAPRPGFRIPRN